MTSKVVLFVPSPAFTGCPARLPRSLGGTSYAAFTSCPYRMALFRSMPLTLSHESKIGRCSGQRGFTDARGPRNKNQGNIELRSNNRQYHTRSQLAGVKL